MYSPYSTKIVPLLVALLCCTLPSYSQAQTVPPPPSPTSARSKADDALRYLQQVLVEDSCSLPLSLKVQNATTDELAALVQKKIAAMDNVPSKPLRVEVRQVRPTRLSFDAQNSTVERVLNSTAILAGAKLWILPHLLIAPETALTAQERSDTKKRMMFTMPDSRKVLRTEVMAAFAAFIKNDVTAGIGDAKALPNKDGETWTKKTTFDQLSPDAQVMVRHLAQYMNDIIDEIPNGSTRPMVLSSDVTVGTTSTPGRSLMISMSKESLPSDVLTLATLGWDDEGEVDFDLKIGPKSKPKPSKNPVGPLPDPSAGDS